MCRDDLRQKLREVARFGRSAATVVRDSGLLPALRLRGLADFARGFRHARGGPSIVIRLHAANTPHKLALIDGDVRLSYRDLDARINRLASALAALGVGPGARVAIMMRNRHEFLEAQWAITRLGALAVQVGYRLKAGEVAYILDHSEPAAILFESELAEVVLAARAQTGWPKDPRGLIATGETPGARGYEAVLASGSDELPAAPGSAGASGGVMIYTSGTTGRPKGATRDFRRALHAPAADFLAQVKFRHDDRHLVVCPLYHAAPPAIMALTYIFGGTGVLVPAGSFDAEQVLALIERERITTSFMVPTLLGRLAALPAEVRQKYDTSSLRWLLSGAAPLPTEIARRVEEAFGPILYNFYGATETGLVTLALPGEHTARPGTIGRALAGNQIRLLDDAGHEVAPGQPGELYVRSTMLVPGYHKNPEATRDATKDGFFSVGDVARVDADGYYYLADRKSDMVISAGVNIYPQEIEQHLYTHPAVADVAVIGIPDADWGESLKAFVVARAGASVSADELRAFCKRGLADYKCPRVFEMIDELPRNPTGKVLKRELRQR
jgi:fatty-acyl-CoA synthase